MKNFDKDFVLSRMEFSSTEKRIILNKAYEWDCTDVWLQKENRAFCMVGRTNCRLTTILGTLLIGTDENCYRQIEGQRYNRLLRRRSNCSETMMIACQVKTDQRETEEELVNWLCANDYFCYSVR